jgi:hypothetical protein
MLVRRQFHHEDSLSEQCEARPTATLCGLGGMPIKEGRTTTGYEATRSRELKDYPHGRLQAILGADQDAWQTKHGISLSPRIGAREQTNLQ